MAPGRQLHQCEHFGKELSRQSTLKAHMLTHTGEKPHQCEHCGNAFARQSDLKKHMLTHTGEKPHQCEHCGKAFARQSTLKTHMLTHTGEKPHRVNIVEINFLIGQLLRNTCSLILERSRISVNIVERHFHNSQI